MHSFLKHRPQKIAHSILRRPNYLKKAGYADVSFVPVSPVPGQRTPDLRATAGAEIVLCEVKTINISDDEMRRQSSGGVATITDTLDPRFFRKLAWDLAKANDQMFAFDSKPTRKKIVYLIVNYDDRLHEYAERYQRQIADFLSVTHPTDVEIVFDIKPPFYTAMSSTYANGRRAIELSLEDEDTAKLSLIAQSRTEPASRVERARILLAYREDPSFFAVSRALGLPPQPRGGPVALAGERSLEALRSGLHCLPGQSGEFVGPLDPSNRKIEEGL
jgi:hypothetical protein